MRTCGDGRDQGFYVRKDLLVPERGSCPEWRFAALLKSFPLHKPKGFSELELNSNDW